MIFNLLLLLPPFVKYRDYWHASPRPPVYLQSMFLASKVSGHWEGTSELFLEGMLVRDLTSMSWTSGIRQRRVQLNRQPLTLIHTGPMPKPYRSVCILLVGHASQVLGDFLSSRPREFWLYKWVGLVFLHIGEQSPASDLCHSLPSDPAGEQNPRLPMAEGAGCAATVIVLLIVQRVGLCNRG